MKAVYVLCNDAGTLQTRKDAQRAVDGQERILFKWEDEERECSSIPGVPQSGYQGWVQWIVELGNASKTFYDDDAVSIRVTTATWAAWQQSQRRTTVHEETLRQMEDRHSQERSALLSTQSDFMKQEYLKAINFNGTWDEYQQYIEDIHHPVITNGHGHRILLADMLLRAFEDGYALGADKAVFLPTTPLGDRGGRDMVSPELAEAAARMLGVRGPPAIWSADGTRRTEG